MTDPAEPEGTAAEEDYSFAYDPELDDHPREDAGLAEAELGEAELGEPPLSSLLLIEVPTPPPFRHSFDAVVANPVVSEPGGAPDLLAQEQEIASAMPAGLGHLSQPRPRFSKALEVFAGDSKRKKRPPSSAQSLDEPEYEEFEKVVRRSPPYLVSIILHMGALIALGLWMWYEPPEDRVSLLVTYSDRETENLDDETFQLGADETPREEEIDPRAEILSEDRQEIFTVKETVPEIDLQPIPLDETSAALPDTPNNDLKHPQRGRLLEGRRPELRERLLRKHGGNRQTEDAVRNALEWLVRNQREDGSWSLQGPYADGGQIESDLAATGLALLALQGAGYTHDATPQTRHSEAVAKGWKWLLDQQTKPGQQIAESHALAYAHAICTIALCELYAMTSDPELRKPAQQAVHYCLEAQGPNGGWRYSKGERGDLSVTGWYVMALQSAQMGKLEVPQQTLAKIGEFLDSVQSDEGRRYGYLGAFDASPPMTAEGLLCRQYLGWKQDDARLTISADYLNQNPINWATRNAYYWYYATQVLHHLGGERWNSWNSVMREVLPAQQLKDGPESGSWHPQGDPWANQGGRLYVTCLHTYMLEVYYRHLPLYDITWGR